MSSVKVVAGGRARRPAGPESTNESASPTSSSGPAESRMTPPASSRYCQVDEKLVDLPPRYWARARREPAMLSIRNGRQPQLDNTVAGALPPQAAAASGRSTGTTRQVRDMARNIRSRYHVGAPGARA